MRLEAARAEEDLHAFGAQGFDTAAERGAAGQGGVDERQDDGRDGEADGFGEDTQGVGVADALGPFVDGVVGGRGDQDGIGNQGPGRAGFGVLAPDRAAGLVLDGGRVEEFECGRGGDDLDRPAAVLGQFDAGADRGGRAGAADDDGQDTAAEVSPRGADPAGELLGVPADACRGQGGQVAGQGSDG